MQKIYNFCLSALLILILFLLVMSGLRRKDEDLAARIAPEILRFHVLANSNSPEDQSLKLEVKDLLLETIRIGLSEAHPELNESDFTRDQILTHVLDHQSELEQTAVTWIAEHGYSYPVDIRFESCHFPEKTYGDMTFPAGTYDAIRVLIGEGKGENFWCVLYPTLCYVDSVYAVVPDDSKTALKALISEDDFLALMTARHKKTGQESFPSRIKIRFKFLEYIGQTGESQE